MIEILDIVDWSLDLGALLLAILTAHAAHQPEQQLRDTFVESVTYMAIIACVYGAHEVWERFFDSHTVFEKYIADGITTALGLLS